MVNEAKISKEVVRLSQLRNREIGGSLDAELARGLAEEAIYNCDPEADLLIDDAAAYSGNDTLVAALGVNDLVVKGHRLDVRRVDETGAVTINRALIATRYMTCGTLAVALDDNQVGKVVGFVPASAWETADRQAGDKHTVSVQPDMTAPFDLAATIDALPTLVPSRVAVPAPAALDLVKFMSTREDLPIEVQRKLVEGMLANEQSWSSLAAVVGKWSKGQIKQILADGALWNGRLDKIVELACARFKRLSAEDIKKIVSKLGEQHGGQPESMAFRKALIGTLTREELTKLVSGATLKKAADVAEAVLSGRSITEAVKEIARNPVSVQIAGHIKRNRDKMGEFVDATTQEILAAFPQVALQPVYGTHSGAQVSSLEPINEALKMLYAGELAKQARELDQELASL